MVRAGCVGCEVDEGGDVSCAVDRDAEAPVLLPREAADDAEVDVALARAVVMIGTAGIMTELTRRCVLASRTVAEDDESVLPVVAVGFSFFFASGVGASAESSRLVSLARCSSA